MGGNYQVRKLKGKILKLKAKILKLKTQRLKAGAKSLLNCSLFAIPYSLVTSYYSLITIILLSLCSTEAKAQQDPQFTQYMFNPVVINPAYTGSREVLSTALVYRHQWVGFDGAPKTQTFSIHSPLRNQNVAMGLYVIHDQIGPKSTTGYFGSYAYRISLPKGKLSMGLRGGIYDFRYNWDKIEYKDITDIYNGQTVSRKIVPNFDFGIYYYTKTFYAGGALSHLGNPRIVKVDGPGKTANLFAHFTGTVGKAIEVNDNVIFKPSAILRTAGTAAVSADLNLSFLFNKIFWFGVAVRTQNSFMVLTEINVTEKFRIGYSYDYTLNRMKNTNSGSHEIFLGYDFELKRSKILSPRYF